MTIRSKGKLPDADLAAKRFLQRISDKVLNVAKDKVPVDKGNLKNALGSRITGKMARVGTMKSVPYAKRLEYGTSRGVIKVKGHYKKIRGKIAYVRPYLVKNQKPRPYLIPAGEKVASEFPEILIAELDKTTK